MTKTIGRLLNWAAERSDVLAKSRADVKTMMERNGQLQYKVGALESDVHEYQREVGKFAERMAKVRVYEHHHQYRVCVDISQEELARLFEHGVQSNGMRFVADWIGREAYKALRECNIVRWADAGKGQ